MIQKLLCGLAFAGAVTASAMLPAAAQVDINLRFGPPPPIYERIPPPPGPGYAWRPGHYHWDGARYVWLRGEYVQRPYERARWVPEHYVRGPEGNWRPVPGHWNG